MQKALMVLEEDELDLIANFLAGELIFLEDETQDPDDSDLSIENQIKYRFFFMQRYKTVKRLVQKIDKVLGDDL